MPPPIPRPLVGVLLACLSFFAAICSARADAPQHAYALVIGSNDGGDGQGRLAFAERDAERMASLVRELGRVPENNLALLTQPTTRDVERALGGLRDKLAAHAEAGERAQLFFYYSGHARASALSLGREELPLDRLRKELLSLPSTLTVVVLDACQSGAFSGVKGASPAADFSLSSVAQLNSTGIAVMASSTGSELSQESRELGSSYFTHHLLASLRGAGDLDRDGKVSLDEAYAYAYEHTLSDTARTQVGSQHATLETDLTGRGNVPLSYPVDADAQLALSADTEGRILVQRAEHGPVMAELVKAKGAILLLALPSGSYDVLVRHGDRAQSCPVTLAKGDVQSFAREHCKDVDLPRETAKLDDEADTARDRHDAQESWFAELGYNLTPLARDDAYTRTLEEFGHYIKDEESPFGVHAVAGYQLHRNIAVVLRYDMLERKHTRSPEPSNETTSQWRSDAVFTGARFRLPLVGRWLVAYAELDVGISLTRTKFNYAEVPSPNSYQENMEVSHGRAFAYSGLGGFDIAFSRHVGMFMAAGYTRAPGLENAFGERRETAGFTVVNGLRLNAVEGWW